MANLLTDCGRPYYTVDAFISMTQIKRYGKCINTHSMKKTAKYLRT